MIASAPAPVITFAGVDAVALGDRVAEVERAAVGVAVERRGAPLERLERRRERAPRPLVRGELDDALEPELALHLLLRLPRLVRDEPVEGGAEEAHRGTTRRRAAPARRRPSSSSARTRGRRRSRRGRRRSRPCSAASSPPTVPGHRLAHLVLHHRLGSHPREPAENGVAPVDDAHGERLTAFARGRSGHVRGPVPRTWPQRPIVAGSEATLQGLRDVGSAPADPTSCDGQQERSDPSGVCATRDPLLRIPSHATANKSEPPPLRQGGGSGRKAGPAGGTAPMWGRGHVLGNRRCRPCRNLARL